MMGTFAAAAALSSHNPAKILSGNYHPTAQSNLLQAFTGSGHGGRVLPMNGDALTVALDVVQIWAVMLTISFTLIIFFFLAFCVCAKRENSYDDFENTQGITTVKVCRNGGENGVHTGPMGTSTLGSPRATDETSEASSRYTHQRELPAIPTNASRSNREAVQTRPAVKEDTQGANVKLIGGVQVLPAGAMQAGGRAAIVKEIDTRDGAKKNIPSSTTHSYVMVSHSKKEHAYAKVVHGNAQETDTDNYDDPELLTKELRSKKSSHVQKASNVQTSQSAAQNRSSIAESEPLTERNNTAVTVPEPAPISAAMAISGRTRANEELPYMTPASLQQTNAQPQQQNYSGDSHDSRGYTSISVREPLAALKARQQQDGRKPGSTIPSAKRPEPESEGYYMTVSDDSADETYACIDENSRNGGSETYARINLPPSVTNHSASSTGPQLSPTAQESFPPAPPSVDSLKHVVHSRQASAGSAASTGLSSPNAERRATKSPLPPVPQGDSDLYSKETTQEPTSEVTRITDTTVVRPLEEMYAKVNKKRSNHSRGNSSGAPDNDAILSNDSSRRSSTDISRQVTSPTSATMTTSLIETSTERNMPSDISQSWSGGPICSPIIAGNYEMPREAKTYSRETSDPGYETVKSGDPPYASVDQHGNYPSYEVVRNQGTSDIDSEHGYETLRHKESEPGYETVQEVSKSIQTRYGNRDSINGSDCEAGYETVNRSTDPGYESVHSREKGTYDPGYEELSTVHARSTSECDPNYEQLKFNTSNSESGYEAVSKCSEGNYELVSDYDTQEKPAPSDITMPLYATVNKKSKISPVEDKVDMNLLETSITNSNETEHISLIQVSDSRSEVELEKPTENVPPVITGAIIKCNPESLNLSDCSTKSANTYPVIESPEDVELPLPEPKDIIAKEAVDLIGSLSDDIPAKTFDVDLITGCFSNVSGELGSFMSPVTNLEEPQLSKSENETFGTDVMMLSEPTTNIDFLSQPLPPPPPTSMIDDISTQVMPLPPPVDDICGQQDLLSDLLLTNTVTGSLSHPSTDLHSAELFEFMNPPPMNGSIDGLENEFTSTRDFPSLMDVPPPPQLEEIEASLAASNSTITVTVNPMAHMQDSPAPPPVSSLIRAALSSESSGSTANGGSVESVVTVDVKNGTEVSTSTPPAGQPSTQSNSSSSDGKEVHEGLTPV